MISWWKLFTPLTLHISHTAITPQFHPLQNKTYPVGQLSHDHVSWNYCLSLTTPQMAQGWSSWLAMAPAWLVESPCPSDTSCMSADWLESCYWLSYGSSGWTGAGRGSGYHGNWSGQGSGGWRACGQGVGGWRACGHTSGWPHPLETANHVTTARNETHHHGHVTCLANKSSPLEVQCTVFHGTILLVYKILVLYNFWW